MNQKKCPKCGEMNPAEAVMCWACYTPLNVGGSGATVATATAGAAPAALATNVAHDEDKEKKAVPPWQIGVIVVGVLVAIGFGVMSFMGGGTSTSTALPGDVPMPPEPPVPQQSLNTGTPPATGELSQGTYSSSSPVPARPLPYTMVTPPNPTIDWGVAAIVPTGQNISASKAAYLAAFARKTFSGTKNRAFQIFVFADSQSAQIFSEYQSRRRGAPLNSADYMALAQVWPRCLASVEFNGSRQIVRYPSQQPNGWWTRR